MNILIEYSCTFGYVFLVLIIALLCKKLFHCSIEVSRKIVHIFVSFTWIILVYFFSNQWYILIPCIFFTIINAISCKTGFLSMIERKEETEKSYGTAYYALSMLILASISVIDKQFLAPFGIGWFCMAFGDGLAPYFGKKFPKIKLTKNKTLAGALTVFISSLLTIIVFKNIYQLPIQFIEILIIAFASMILEMISIKGFDNLILPIGVALLSYFFLIF